MAAGASRPAALYRPEGSPLFAVCRRSRQNRRAGFPFCVDLPQSGYYNHNRSRTQNGRGRITAFTQRLALRGGGQQPVHCRFAAEVSCKAGQGLALCSAGGDLRAKSRHFVLCTPKRRLRAAVLASSRKTLRRRKAPRRAKSPALHCGRERAAIYNRQPPAGGPMKSSAPAQGAALHNHHPPAMPAVPDPAARLPYIVGRAFTPAGKVCGGLEGYWQGQVRHPSVG